jgi:hypothetical protein
MWLGIMLCIPINVLVQVRRRVTLAALYMINSNEDPGYIIT